MSLTLIPDFDLSSRNTLALRARSRLGVIISNVAQLPELLALARAERLPLRILGGGSNVVLAPEFDGVTAMMDLRGRTVIGDDADGVTLEVAAGETWHELVAWTVAQGFGGIENLALIPGTVGAAPVQNIGAYGAELADVLEQVTAYDRATGSEVVLNREQCRFAYRDSLFKQVPDRYVVLSVRLRLPRPWVPNLGFAGLSDLGGEVTPQAVMDRVVALRTSKLPDWRVNPNAGSFFQNPIVAPDVAQRVLDEFPTAPAFPQADGRLKLSAGWLIERAGLKGFRMGPVGMSERHALVVVNHGGAVQADVMALAGHVKDVVEARFGVRLHEEPVFL
jgi:UDP-N-acetylmuramate dehydrogenase